MKLRKHSEKTRRNDIDAKCRSAAHAARRTAGGNPAGPRSRQLPACTCPRCGRSTRPNMFVCPHCGAQIAMPQRQSAHDGRAEAREALTRRNPSSPEPTRAAEAGGRQSASVQGPTGAGQAAPGAPARANAKRQRYLSEEAAAQLAATLPRIAVA